MVETDSISDAQNPSGRRVSAGRVLFVEDNPALAQVVSFNLERAGYEVATVPDGYEAWLVLQHDAFDVVITDEQMPRMTGRELCSRMRVMEAIREIPVIFLTAKCLELDHGRLEKELGVSRVLGKPFSPRQLAETVRQVLAASRRVQVIST